MLSPSCLILNIWPEAGCEVMISSEIFWFSFGNNNTLFSSTNQSSSILWYGDIPHSLGDIPGVSERTRTIFWIERSLLRTKMNLEVSLAIWITMTNGCSAVSWLGWVVVAWDSVKASMQQFYLFNPTIECRAWLMSPMWGETGLRCILLVIVIQINHYKLLIHYGRRWVFLVQK